MTRREHRRRHIEWHRAFDELLADFPMHNPGTYTEPKLPSNTTLIELMEWSYRQTIEPEEKAGRG